MWSKGCTDYLVAIKDSPYICAAFGYTFSHYLHINDKILTDHGRSDASFAAGVLPLSPPCNLLHTLSVTKHICSHIHTRYIDYFITEYYLFCISEALNSIYETSLLTKHPSCAFIQHIQNKLSYYL